MNIIKKTQKNEMPSYYSLLAMSYKMGKRQDQGFAMVAILGFCLIAIVLGAAMMVKANANRLTATNTQQTVQAEKSAEAGSNKVITALKQNPILLTLNMSDWNTTAIQAKITELNANGQLKDYRFAQSTTGSSSNATGGACNGIPTTTTTATGTSVVSALNSAGIGITAGTTGAPAKIWNNVTTLASGENLSYQFMNYINTGQMTIGGRVGGTGGSGAESYANVNFPVNINAQTVSSAVPAVNAEGIGLWVKASSSSSDIRTNILVTCPSSGTIWAQSPFAVTGYKIIGTNMTMPPTPAIPTANIRTITNASETIPTSADIAATGTSAPYVTNADGTREYRYQIASISSDFTVNVPPRTGVPTGKYDQISVYLTGNIDLQGGQTAIKNDGITVSNGNLVYPANTGELQLRIIGKATTGAIHLGGNASICSAFIHAPTYDLDINGGGQAQGCYQNSGPLNMSTGGTQNPNNRGVYWINSWSGGGQGNHVAHLGTGAGTGDFDPYLGNMAIPSLGAPNGWAKIQKPGT